MKKVLQLVLYANAIYISVVALGDFLNIWKTSWVIGLALTVTSIGLIAYGTGPVLAWYAPKMISEWTSEPVSGKRKAWRWLAGTVLALTVPYLILTAVDLILLWLIL